MRCTTIRKLICCLLCIKMHCRISSDSEVFWTRSEYQIVVSTLRRSTIHSHPFHFASIPVCGPNQAGNSQFNSGAGEIILSVKDDTGSDGNQIVYYLHSKVLLIYFRYQYFPVQLYSIEWASNLGPGHIYFIHPAQGNVDTFPSTISQGAGMQYTGYLLHLTIKGSVH